MPQNIKPIDFLKRQLPFQALKLRCLDKERKPIANATGFIRKDNNRLWVYTCWHVVTGLDRNDIQFKLGMPKREYLEVSLQDVNARNETVQAIGGVQSIIIPLYDPVSGTQCWHQDKRHIPHKELNTENIFVPYWYDTVRIPLPDEINLSHLQVIEEDEVLAEKKFSLLTVAEKVYVVGFPYGFSSVGDKQPTPVVLTRHIATLQSRGRREELLLDGYGAPSMSGGPVFIERGSNILLLGMYTGLLYPDHELKRNEKVTALGIVSDLTIHFWGYREFTNTPDESSEGT